MAWCPKCRNEYREGITICAECGCELIAEEPAVERVPIVSGARELMEELKRFMEYSQLADIKVSCLKEEDTYVLEAKSADKEMAAKIAKVFLEQRELEKVSVRTQVSAGLYHSSAQKAEENRSSAWTFLVVGSIGLLAMVLCILGILPFRTGNPYLVYGVMSAVFILFIVMGFMSMKSARLFARNAESENSLINTLLEWCKGNLKAEKIDAQISDREELAEEVLYLRRYEILRNEINHQFMNLDQELVEHLIEDEVYSEVFGDQECP